MLRHALIAVPALAMATSCVPNPEPKPVAATHVPIPPPPVLLKQLDLNVPEDLMDKVLPAAFDRTPVNTAIPAAPAFLAQTHTSDDAARAIDCLTQAVYYEARSQSVDGQRAVAQVVLNRVRDPAFPASVCGVVYQGSHRATGCQFTFTCDGSLYHPREPGAWTRAKIVAMAALAGAVYAPVGSATFYHADYVSPWWAQSMTQVARIGQHIFYRWRGAMENALAYRQTYSGLEPAATGGGSAPATAVAGVAVHYNGEAQVEGGVMVHRGGAPAIVPAAAVATPAAKPPAAGIMPATSFSAGVRVHRGVEGPATMPVDDAPVQASDPI